MTQYRNLYNKYIDLHYSEAIRSMNIELYLHQIILLLFKIFFEDEK